MRLDLYLSKVGLVKRRSKAKELASSGLVEINGKNSKPSYEIKIGDIVKIGGKQMITAELLDIPNGNVKKEDREKYFKILN
ncbi:MAG: RNA-binding S4 domain-containing protein [candidate division Zixibacteria bacterium]|nr:RNA-binding S4 domain-containing protein [candidate division Zixibacteria bacterium]